MTEASQTEEYLEEVKEIEKRPRFGPEKTAAKVPSKKKSPALPSRKRVPNRPRITNVWRQDIAEKEFLMKLKNA